MQINTTLQVIKKTASYEIIRIILRYMYNINCIGTCSIKNQNNNLKLKHWI